MALALARTSLVAGISDITACFTVTPSGNYATGGDAMDLRGIIGFTDKDPIDVKVKGVGGYDYEYDYTNRKLKVRDFPSVQIVGGQGAASALQINPDSNVGVLGKTVATTRNIPGATFGFQMGEIAGAAAYPAGVTGDVIQASVRWLKQ